MLSKLADVSCNVHFCMLANELCLAVGFCQVRYRLLILQGADESRMDIFDDVTLSVLEGKSRIKFIFDVFMLFIYSLLYK